MESSKYECCTSIIIPSRKYDYILENTIFKIRELYKKINIILILDDMYFCIDKIPADITVLKSNSLNMSAKRNQGVMHVNTEYIAFLDSDAYPQRNWLETGIKFLNNNQKYSAVFGIWENPETDSFEQICTRVHRFMPLFARKDYWKLIDKSAKEEDSNEFISANVIIRRKDYVDVGMMNEQLYIDEDIELSNRMSQKGYKTRFVPEVSVYHRESNIYSYIRKVFCGGYYYTNMRFNGNCQKELKTFENHFKNSGFWHLYPFILTFIYIFSMIILLTLNISILPMIIIGVSAFTFIIYNCIKATKNLENKKFKGFLYLFWISILFCTFYIIGTLLGILNIQAKHPYDMFKQY